MSVDREKLAREKIKEELQAAHTHGTEWPDIAIAYADRRVAEERERIANSLEEWCDANFDPNNQALHDKAVGIFEGVEYIRALSPAKGEDK